MNKVCEKVKMRIKNHIGGFTLIELLVVMAIIGILAALTLTGFGAARKNARDTQRKSDLQQYRVALEGYNSNNSGKYPNIGYDDLNGDGSFNNGNIFKPTGVIIDEYLPTEIRPPLSLGFGGDTYSYDGDGSGNQWVLQATLETGGYWTICSNGKAGKYSAAPGDTVNADCPL